MRKSITLSIPKPCYQDWDNMPKTHQGVHCAKCSLNVIDFTNKTDTEVYEMLTANKGKLCGIFKDDQMSRPLTKTEPAKGFSKWKSILALAAAFLATRVAAKPVSDTAPAPVTKTVMDTAIIKKTLPVIKQDTSKPVKMVTIKGRVWGKFYLRPLSRTRRNTDIRVMKPLQNIEIGAYDSEDGPKYVTRTDKKGRFTLQVPDTHVSIYSRPFPEYGLLAESKEFLGFKGKKKFLSFVHNRYQRLGGCPRF